MKEKIEAILLEYDGDAKRGYFHEPRTEKAILELISQERKQWEDELREKIGKLKPDSLGMIHVWDLSSLLESKEETVDIVKKAANKYLADFYKTEGSSRKG